MTEGEVRNLWNLNAEEWRKGVASKRDIFRYTFHDPAFFSLLPLRSVGNALDLGCGEGSVSRSLAERGWKVVGVDISEAMIAEAISTTPPELEITYHTLSASQLEGLADDSFELVSAAMVLMDTPNLQEIFKEGYRVLKPGGKLIFSVTHPFWDRQETIWLTGATNRIRLQPGNYFQSESWIDEWSFSHNDESALQRRSFRILTYPYKISDYMNTASKLGFRLKHVLEPEPPKLEKYSELFERWKRTPFYLMVCLEK